jgi:predicted component of type VI protein secretion system
MSTESPLLVVEESGDVHRLHLDAAVFGRSKTCDLSFDRPGVSRRHCEIVLRPDGALVRDLGSSHGTLLDGRRIHGEAPLQAGQVVRLGPRGPQLRMVELRSADAPPAVDEPAPAGDRDVAPTESADVPAPRTGARTATTRDAGTGTVVATVPRHATAPASAPPPGDAEPVARESAAPRGGLADVVLGLALGGAAGVVVLVAVDLAPLRAALGLE